MNTFKPASKQTPVFTFSGENNMTPDQCFIGYAVETYHQRHYSQKMIDDEYGDQFIANSPATECLVTKALKNAEINAKIRKAKVILKKYLNSSNDPLTRSWVEAFKLTNCKNNK